MTTGMHPDELELPVSLVRDLVSAQFPQWADETLERVRSTGTENAMYRLGASRVVRLPRRPSAAGNVDHEAVWLPRIADRLPVAVPRLLGVGRPGDSYPWTWAVLSWVPGSPAEWGELTRPLELARDLARLVRAIRALDLPDGDFRGLTLAQRDDQVRRDIAALEGEIDVPAVTAVWESALASDTWDGVRRWTHKDLAPGNLLLTDGRLTGLIDFAAIGLADPVYDLGVAWNLLPPPARAVFRRELDVDDATWERARAHALAQALVQLPYYRDTNPALAGNARHVIREVLAETA